VSHAIDVSAVHLDHAPIVHAPVVAHFDAIHH
jgi:hypothetical protein